MILIGSACDIPGERKYHLTPRCASHVKAKRSILAFFVPRLGLIDVPAREPFPGGPDQVLEGVRFH